MCVCVQNTLKRRIHLDFHLEARRGYSDWIALTGWDGNMYGKRRACGRKGMIQFKSRLGCIDEQCGRREMNTKMYVVNTRKSGHRFFSLFLYIYIEYIL